MPTGTPASGVPLGELELDALREVANIGCGHAATVLSQMIGMRVMVDVPRLSLERVAEVARRMAPTGEPLVVLTMRIVGDLTGETTFVLKQANAQTLCDLLLQRPAGSGGLGEPMERSALMEAGNVMASGFLNALSVFLNRCLLPSPPHFAFGTATDLERQEAAAAGGSEAPVLVATTSFRFDDPALTAQGLQGMFLFALDEAARAALFTGLRRPAKP